MEYVIFENVATGELHEGMVYGTYRRPRTRQERAFEAKEMLKHEYTVDHLKTEMQFNNCKRSLRNLNLASITTGIASVATLINNFTEETALSHGFEDVMEYAESPECLAGAAVAFGLMGVAYLFKKAADHKRAEKYELKDELEYIEYKYDKLVNPQNYASPISNQFEQTLEA